MKSPANGDQIGFLPRGFRTTSVDQFLVLIRAEVEIREHADPQAIESGRQVAGRRHPSG